MESLSLVCVLFALSISSTFAQTGKEKFAWCNPVLPARVAETLPPGLRHGSFISPSMEREVGYFIYLPDAYGTIPEREFPVVFHLHGGRPGDERKSVRISGFIDEAIRAGKIQPTIYVFPNGGPVSWYDYPGLEKGEGARVFVEELIPHLRRTYRTRELSIEGFSQGGRGTTRIAFRNPELFVSAAPGGSGYEQEKRVQENDGAESESVVFAPGDNTWDLAETYAARPDKERLPLLLWFGTKDFNYQGNLLFSERLEQLGIPHRTLVAEGAEHSAVENYQINGDALMQFHQAAFAAP